jgi:hypothetical protein
MYQLWNWVAVSRCAHVVWGRNATKEVTKAVMETSSRADERRQRQVMEGMIGQICIPKPFLGTGLGEIGNAPLHRPAWRLLAEKSLQATGPS